MCGLTKVLTAGLPFLLLMVRALTARHRTCPLMPRPDRRTEPQNPCPHAVPMSAVIIRRIAGHGARTIGYPRTARLSPNATSTPFWKGRVNTLPEQFLQEMGLQSALTSSFTLPMCSGKWSLETIVLSARQRMQIYRDAKR